jgi:probable phosphoglycerate mutase
MLTELILVRHGETHWNREGRIQGHRDTPLSPLGRRQAEALAARLRAVEFSALYSSDLKRAAETAACIAAASGQGIQTDPRLRERNLGLFEGLTGAQAEARYPDAYRRYREGDPAYSIPDGESLEQRHERALDCLQEIARRHRGGRAVVVTHGGVLDSAFRHTLGLALGAPRRFSLLNASINRVAAADESWRLIAWGDTGHLLGFAPD